MAVLDTKISVSFCWGIKGSCCWIGTASYLSPSPKDSENLKVTAKDARQVVSEYCWQGLKPDLIRDGIAFIEFSDQSVLIQNRVPKFISWVIEEISPADSSDYDLFRESFVVIHNQVSLTNPSTAD